MFAENNGVKIWLKIGYDIHGQDRPTLIIEQLQKGKS
jgi:hypothetical protein